MATAISFSSLIPAGLAVERFQVADDVLFVTACVDRREDLAPALCEAEAGNRRRIVGRDQSGTNKRKTDLPPGR
ncbi:MAG: hypothetical protein V7704_05845 [Aurantimonas endophytica]|uniref:hypothetical protein n=1 Tax=Aurantimonas endophytica TaxID=1522175 RepID=UPI003002D820